MSAARSVEVLAARGEVAVRALLVSLVLVLQLGSAPVAAAGPPEARPPVGVSDRLQLGSAHVIDGDDAVPLSPGARTATGIAVPDGDDATFLVGTAAGQQTEVGLPVATDGPARTSDGALVYDDAADVSVTVRAVDVSQDRHLSAALQAVIVIDDVLAPTEYSFPLRPPPGGSARLEPHGAVSVLDRDGGRVGMFTAPWAVDAAGQPVRTWFDLRGRLARAARRPDRPHGLPRRGGPVLRGARRGGRRSRPPPDRSDGGDPSCGGQRRHRDGRGGREAQPCPADGETA